MSAPDRDFERKVERAWFTLKGAESLGVRFAIRDGRFLEVDYPLLLDPTCWRSLQDAILASREMLAKIVAVRTGAAS